MGEFDPKALRDSVERAAGLDLELAFRPMFGGVMAYAGGRSFASLSNRGLALKLDPADMAELPGAAPLRYEPDDPPSRTYTLVPRATLRDAGALRPWLLRSGAYVAASPARKRARR